MLPEAAEGAAAGCDGRRTWSRLTLSLDCHQKWRMAFNPRRVFTVEAAGIATLVPSVAALSVVLFW